jgi:transposase InsO family protein
MDLLDPVDHAEAVALFRAEVIGGLARRALTRGELRAALRTLAQTRFRPPGAAATRTFSLPTLERWYYDYRRGGLTALRPVPRSDRGRAHALTATQRALLCDIRREHPAASAPLIVRTLIADGRLAAGVVSPTTVARLYREQGLDRIAARAGDSPKTRLRWEAAAPHALWHGDVCHGPALLADGVARPLRIHGLLDDASRAVVALEAHHAEREVDMLGLLVAALRRHGRPSALYLDNGATYRGEALRVACGRLGIALLHARPYDAPARGKMERFWRTLREGCLATLGTQASLAAVQVRLDTWLAEHYHRAPHAALFGRTPGEVLAAGPPPDRLAEQALADALTVRARRRVRRDSTVSVAGQTWETDQGWLAGRLVTVAHCLLEPPTPPWLEHEAKRFALHRVDPRANAHRTRPPRRPRDTAAPTAPVAFDPHAALVTRAARDGGR